MKFSIGADAGGTKTYAAAYVTGDNQIKLSAEYTAGAGNLALDYFSARCEIFSAIRAVFSAVISAYPTAECELIAVGAAGASAQIDGKSAVDVLSAEISNEFKRRAIVMSDVMLAYTAAFGSAEQKKDTAQCAKMIIISGTGSIVMLHHGNKFYRAGGYGHLIGDGGSGYFTGISAIRKILASRDRGVPDAALESAVLGLLNLNAASELIPWVYAPERQKSDIAQISAEVSRLAQANSESAAQIIRESAAALAADAANTVFHAETDEERPLHEIQAALYGGNLTNSSVFRHAFRESLSALVCQKINIMDAPPNPTYAAAVLSSV